MTWFHLRSGWEHKVWSGHGEIKAWPHHAAAVKDQGSSSWRQVEDVQAFARNPSQHFTFGAQGLHKHSRQAAVLVCESASAARVVIHNSDVLLPDVNIYQRPRLNRRSDALETEESLFDA